MENVLGARAFPIILTQIIKNVAGNLMFSKDWTSSLSIESRFCVGLFIVYRREYISLSVQMCQSTWAIVRQNSDHQRTMLKCRSNDKQLIIGLMVEYRGSDILYRPKGVAIYICIYDPFALTRSKHVVNVSIYDQFCPNSPPADFMKALHTDVKLTDNNYPQCSAVCSIPQFSPNYTRMRLSCAHARCSKASPDL
jgi:hypothetical protein